MKKVRSQKSEVRSKNRTIYLIIFLFLTSYFLLPTYLSAAEWGGVDESVVEKYAEEHGRAARDPFINTDQGDLLLFVFLLAGAVGGFAAGYYWRILMVERVPKISRKEQKITDCKNKFTSPSP
jgi:hypothetical protein